MRTPTFIRRVTQLFAALVAALPLLVSAGPVACGDKPIRLAFYEYGYFYFDKGRGIDKDVVDELIRRSSCRFDLQVMTRARIWADLASGDLDMSVSGIQTPERDRFAWFAPYLSMKNHVLVRKNLAPRTPRGEDFIAQPALQFGVVRAFRHGVEQDRWLETLRTAQRVQESPDVETLFRKLGEGRIDAMFSQPPVYRKNMQDLGLQDEIAVLDWTPDEKGVPHGLIMARSRFSEANARQWRTLIREMRADGTLKKIYLRYLPPAEATKLLEFQPAL